MARIAVFSKYFGYNVGGAERSMLAMMLQLEADGHEIVAYVNNDPKHYGAGERKFQLPISWAIRKFSLSVDWTRFRFVEYFFNRRALQALASTMEDIDILYAYGHMAPAVLLNFPLKRVYLARDEYGLGWNRNYYSGLRALLQYAYFLLEAPFRLQWLQDLQVVVSSSMLIANSDFIASGFRQLAPTADIHIVPPQLDAVALKAEYEQPVIEGPIERGVVAVGDNILKGGDIVRRVARLMPEQRFYLFDRKYTKPIVDGNMTFMPWQSSQGTLYRYAEIVMVPSRVNEAFGRVVIEAQSLKIPVVASNRGGLSEAIADSTMLVDAIEDPHEWVRFITLLIKLEQDAQN